MELEGVKRCFAAVTDAGITVKTFVSDRHRGVAKWLRESFPQVHHYFDIWHIARTLTKKLLEAAKEKNCEIISRWIASIRNHLYWCATSTKEGFGSLIIAKWKSFMRHVQNKHDSHPDNLFSQCAHEPLDKDRHWIKNGKLQLHTHKLLYMSIGMIIHT